MIGAKVHERTGEREREREREERERERGGGELPSRVKI